MTALVWSYVTSGVIGALVGVWAVWWSGRRERRRQRRHEVRIRLVDLQQNEWLNVTCTQLDVIRRYGGQDEPPWQTLETIRDADGRLFRLQVAPAHLD